MKKILFTIFAGTFLISFFVSSALIQSTRPLVSVILPTYNRYTYLPRAIDSVLNQTYPYWELIIIDDGSTDDSERLIKKYIQKDKRIRLIRNNQNKGISFSRNIGHKIARGKYIAPMDSDDISDKNRLAIEVEYLEKNKNIAVVSAFTRDMDTGKLYKKDPFSALILFDNNIGHPETLIRKSFLDEHRIQYNETFMAAVDYDLWAQILLAGGQFHILPYALATIRLHTQNPKKYYKAQFNNKMKISKKLFEFYEFPARFFNSKTGYPIRYEQMTQTQKCDFFTHVMTQDTKHHFFKKTSLPKMHRRACFPLNKK